MLKEYLKSLAICAALGILLAGCASAVDVSRVHLADRFGNAYPTACQGDLSYVKAPVMYVSPAQMRAWADAVHVKRGYHLFGLTLGGKVILIDNTLRGWVREDTLHHERCHVVAGNWHS